MIRTQILRPVAWLLVLMLVIGVIGYIGLELTGNMELVLLRLEVEHAEALAAQEAATADRLRAAKEYELGRAEGLIFRAAADTIERQSWVATWYAVVGPVGLLAAFLAVGVGCGTVGVTLGGIGGVLLSQKYNS